MWKLVVRLSDEGCKFTQCFNRHMHIMVIFYFLAPPFISFTPLACSTFDSYPTPKCMYFYQCLYVDKLPGKYFLFGHFYSIQGDQNLNNGVSLGDISTQLITVGKRGGSSIRDPFQEKMEDFISNMELIDIKLVNIKYTWSYQHVVPKHIPTHLDRFLVKSNFLEKHLAFSSWILDWGISYHCPISIYLFPNVEFGPFPFRFNPQWLKKKEFQKWCLMHGRNGSPVFFFWNKKSNNYNWN